MSEWQHPDPSPHPYGGHQPYGGSAPVPPTDGVSIAAFVCALTCCAGPVGVGLGIAGIIRTKDGRRRGRWAAITGIVVGVLGTLAIIAGFVGVVVVGTNIVYEDGAEVGQCVNTGFLGTETDDLWEAECSEEHDAEIVAVQVATAELEADYDAGVPIEEICAPFVDESYEQLVDDPRYRMDFATDSFDDEVSDGDWLVCFLESADDEPLDGPLTGGGPAGA